MKGQKTAIGGWEVWEASTSEAISFGYSTTATANRYGRIFEVPYGFLWMVDAKYYGTGRHLLVKAVSLDKAFEGLEALICEVEPSGAILN